MALSTREVAKSLNTSEISLLRMVWDGRVNPDRIGLKTYLWTNEAIEEAREALAAKPARKMAR